MESPGSTTEDDGQLSPCAVSRASAAAAATAAAANNNDDDSGDGRDDDDDVDDDFWYESDASDTEHVPSRPVKDASISEVDFGRGFSGFLAAAT